MPGLHNEAVVGQDGVRLPGPARAEGDSVCLSVCPHGYRRGVGGVVMGQEARGETDYVLEPLAEAAVGALNPSLSSKVNV